jgi:uncharacterized protein (DUF2147 family)
MTTVSPDRRATGMGAWRDAKKIAGAVMGVSLQRSLIVGLVLLFGVAALPLRAAEPTATGLWEQADERTGKPESWFKITERNGIFEGAFAKIFFKPGEDPNWVCDKCQGADKGRPVQGLTFIRGMQRNGLAYEGGTIMDPRDGQVYRALMRLTPDGKTLEVRGYLGIALFGQSQIWHRLPDNALSSGDSRPAPRGTAPQKR